MPYVVRQADGGISAILNQKTAEAEEHLPADHPEIIAFMGADPETAGHYSAETRARLALQDTDTDIARVTEDLVHLLVKKNVILFTELPEMVQEKLMSREQLRTQLNTSEYMIISDDETL